MAANKELTPAERAALVQAHSPYYARKREYNRRYRAKHKDKLNAYARKYYAANKDKIKPRMAVYIKAHKAELNAYAREYYQTHKLQHKLSFAKYYKKHKAAINASYKIKNNILRKVSPELLLHMVGYYKSKKVE